MALICNDTMWPLEVSEGNIVAWGAVCATISPVVIAFNILLIVAMVKTKDLQSFTSRYVICLCVSDIGMGAIVLPLLCCMLFVEDLRKSCLFQRVVQCIAYSLGYTSFFLLVAIGVDRYLLIKKLTQYNLVMSNFRWRLIVGSIAVISISLSVVTVTAYSFHLHAAFILANIVCIGGIYLLYVKLLFRVDRQSTVVKRTTTKSLAPTVSTSMKNRKRKRDISVARTVRLLLGAIFILYMPYNVISLVWTYYRFQRKATPIPSLSVAVFWSYILMFMNGIANVLIYGHGKGKIRHFIKSLAHIGQKERPKISSKSADDSESEMMKNNTSREKFSP